MLLRCWSVRVTPLLDLCRLVVFWTPAIHVSCWSHHIWMTSIPIAAHCLRAACWLRPDASSTASREANRALLCDTKGVTSALLILNMHIDEHIIWHVDWKSKRARLKCALWRSNWEASSSGAPFRLKQYINKMYKYIFRYSYTKLVIIDTKAST